MANDSFVFYESFYQTIQLMPEEQQLAAYKSLIEYALHGEEENTDGMVSIFMSMAKPLIDSAQKKRRDGSKGGRPSQKKTVVKEAKTSGFETKNHRFAVAETPPSNDGNENENDNEHGDGNANVSDHHHELPSAYEELPADMRDPAFAEIVTRLQVEAGATLTQTQTQELMHWLDDVDSALVLYAVETAATSATTGRFGWPYVNGILKRWDSEKLNTVELVKASEEHRKRQKQKDNVAETPKPQISQEEKEARRLKLHEENMAKWEKTNEHKHIAAQRSSGDGNTGGNAASGREPPRGVESIA